MQEKYCWLPFEQIRRIELSAPKHLRELIWASARVETTGGTIGEVFIPTLYAGSIEQQNDQVRLGRITDWKQLSKNLYLTVGLRLLLVDDEERAILEVKSIEFDHITNGESRSLT